MGSDDVEMVDSVLEASDLLPPEALEVLEEAGYELTALDAFAFTVVEVTRGEECFVVVDYEDGSPIDVYAVDPQGVEFQEDFTEGGALLYSAAAAEVDWGVVASDMDSFAAAGGYEVAAARAEVDREYETAAFEQAATQGDDG